ncbi:hypothetical protein KP509_18G059300 [Ceratopteris richardii]|uniref:Uncharacterized protein n=1 Tax=Ceratopteris richardii TaxID=49495 RepID=A0A8T2SS48_CERRI|nr:hypothetical protein KP509_18G059300 [Ceratopteris richardii]KAH7366017.1 hypothetical protein KP509_18G059300 [Ceratopteris richardii]
MATTRWWTENTIALVTGGNKGIGFEIVKKLGQEGSTVILTARDQERGLAATENLKGQGLNVVYHVLDVLSATSISQLAEWLKQKYNGFDILINNAGITDYEPSFASAQMVLDTNYRAVKEVTRQLLPLLRPSAAGARIVNVSSILGQLARLKNPALREEMGNLAHLTEDKVDRFVENYLEDVKEQKAAASGWPYRSYTVSKIALNAYTRVLAESLKGRPDGQHIYANSVTPGYCKTDLTRNSGIYTAAEGAETPVWVALLPPNGPTGKFFSEKHEEEF